MFGQSLIRNVNSDIWSKPVYVYIAPAVLTKPACMCLVSSMRFMLIENMGSESREAGLSITVLAL